MNFHFEILGVDYNFCLFSMKVYVVTRIRLFEIVTRNEGSQVNFYGEKQIPESFLIWLSVLLKVYNTYSDSAPVVLSKSGHLYR